MNFLAAALFAAATAATGTTGGGVAIDPVATGESLAAAFEKTVARTDADISSEVEAGGYRIGLIVGPGRVVRPRSLMGKFVDSNPPEPDLTFVGVVLRDPRTKRFLPGARVTALLEFEAGGTMQLDELDGRYPIYGGNFQIPPKEMRGIVVTVHAPFYNRHAEMLAAFTEEATTRFEVEARGMKQPYYQVKDPKRPGPAAADWKQGNDLRQAMGESRSVVRSGEFLIGFVAEGPEPIWLWTGDATPPQHCAVTEKDTNHIEAVVVHEPSGLMVTSANVALRFQQAGDTQDFILRPLLAEFFHYGLTAPIPPGEWKVTAIVEPPRLAGWGTKDMSSPQGRLIAGFTFTREAPAGAQSPEDEAKTFARKLSRSAERYGAGEKDAALQEVTDLFFAFEGSELDKKLRASDPAGYKALEAEWIALRGRIQNGAKPTEVGVSAEKIGRALVFYAEKLKKNEGSSSGAFVQSFMILLREGFEAILVLGLMVTVLRKTKREAALRYLWGGALAALAASALLALVFSMVTKNLGAAQEAFEGVVILLSMVVLFVTSFWLVSRVEGRRWGEFVKHQIEGAATGGRAGALFSLAFLVVFREGVETVLMYASLFATATTGRGPIFGGIAVAALALAAIYMASSLFGAKIPVRPFFAVSGALLYVLCFKFAGDGIFELQAATVLPSTHLSWVPDSPSLQGWLGIRPTVESCALQAALVLAVLAGLAWTLRKRPEPASGAPVAG